MKFCKDCKWYKKPEKSIYYEKCLHPKIGARIGEVEIVNGTSVRVNFTCEYARSGSTYSLWEKFVDLLGCETRCYKQAVYFEPIEKENGK